ncbi:hypothetical protein MBM_00328 [Drepanopeziza brunnea f. sp. 'multigermtubi' MB_m1]|uniref:Uncharacterized protein n=1 Tax=Marssonina brunnea f. sp. multigermtubi (strain MB_m1) TaxID=1072389 RepID=K1WU86_MARBU|nr:uncharacterized protein MBM_00328 [Drepanopeziza brunnea f. sp. 'multigermtubi' MB_m1]EKD21215.1 hypothetical protein MBM_00328 [Drepanopeziza brunnea f. sp. 'multigermtubi' MB_m1]
MVTLATWARSKVTHLPRASRMVLGTVCGAFIFICLYTTREMREISLELTEQHIIEEQSGVYRVLKGAIPSVNLVVAATSKEDYGWTKELRIPSMTVVPYIADDLNATHHAQQNKGHEAMMYHQYFYDFYDNLPDISILIHSQQRSWHVDGMLDQSMVFSLNHLDLREVQRRHFLNLRVTWGIGCSNGQINTTRVNEESGAAPEQKEMQEAFRANFNIYDVPEILATPCCSQIAVTKAAIRRVPREQYLKHIEWLLATQLKDSISGRTWEHMWQYLFLGKAIDCPLEHRAYCRLYHICFGGREEYDEWVELNQGREKLENELDKLKKEMEKLKKDEKDKAEPEKDKDGKPEKDEKDKAEPEKTDEEQKKLSATQEKTNKKAQEWLETELKSVREAIRVRREVAVVRGAVEANRIAEAEPLYGDEDELGVEAKIFPQKVKAQATTTRSP